MCVFLKGLNALQNLEELNLADNNIEKIGRFFFFCDELDWDSVCCLKKY